MGCRCNHGDDCPDGHVALGSRCSSDSDGASEALLTTGSSRHRQHECQDEGSECDEEEDLDEDDETRGLCSGGGAGSRRTQGAEGGESGEAGDESDESSTSCAGGTEAGNNANENDAGDDLGDDADRTSGGSGVVGGGVGDVRSDAGLLAASESGGLGEEARSGGARKGIAAAAYSVTGSRRRSSDNRSRGSGQWSSRGRGSCVSSSAVHILLEEQHNNEEQEQRCFDGRNFFSRLANLFSTVVFCGSTRFRKGCSMVSCSSSSSGRSAAVSSPQLEVVAAAAAIAPPSPTTGVLIRVAGHAASSSPLSGECFSSPLSLDTDASERLLPRPARAAARAAAAAAAGGGYDGGGSGGASASGAVLQRRFLTLHRRRRRRPAAPMAPHKALLDDLYPGPTQSVLDRVGEWDFNAFALDSVSGGRPVSVLCVYLLYKYDLINVFRMDTVTVWKCFSLIEEGYHTTNPYHNAVHAADVTQAMHCYLQEPEINSHLTPLEALAALLAAVCHDLDHPGVNQPFLIATDNHLAALYKNLSVLENHHWRCGMGCLWESGLLQGWPAETVAQLQDQIRSLILATDITRQQEFLIKFKKYQETGTMDMEDAECRHFSLQIALKCADICNPCRPWEVSKKWSQKICDEFYRQGDYERQLNIPVTALCDRYITSVAKIQTGFIQFIVCPLFGAWHQWLDTGLSSTMMKNLKNNLSRWQDKLSEDAAKAAACDLPSGVQRALPSTEGNAAEDAEEPTESEVDHSAAESSTDSSSDTVGNLSQSIACAPQTVVSRRHSLPLNVPSMLPRTVIRRESLSSDGQYPIVLETVQMEGMSLSTLSQAEASFSGIPGDSELVSVVTKMEGSPPSVPRHSQVPSYSKSGRRRMSLPQLSLAHHQRYKQQISTLQPLPATPSLEELRLPGNLQPSSSAGEGGEGRAGQGSSSCQQSQESQRSACHESSTKDQSVGGEDRSSSSCGGENSGSGSSHCDAPDSTEDGGVGRRTYNNPSESGNGASCLSNKLCSSLVSCVLPPSSTNLIFSANTLNPGKESQMQPAFGYCSASASSSTPSRFSRRASLDSNTCCTNLNLNGNLNVVHQHNLRNNLNNLSSSAANLKNGSNNSSSSNTNANFSICEELATIINSNHNSKILPRRGAPLLDKENRAPPPCSKVRASMFARTRHWRSLTQDDDGDSARGGHTKQPYPQVNPSLRGRRGSAPVLQVDAVPRPPSMRFQDCDIPSELGHACLSRRRASAPANHLLQGRAVTCNWFQENAEIPLEDSHDQDQTSTNHCPRNDRNMNQPGEEASTSNEAFRDQLINMNLSLSPRIAKPAFPSTAKTGLTMGFRVGRRKPSPFLRRASFGCDSVSISQVKFALANIEDESFSSLATATYDIIDEGAPAPRNEDPDGRFLNPSIPKIQFQTSTYPHSHPVAPLGVPEVLRVKEQQKRHPPRPPLDRANSLPHFGSSLATREEEGGILDNAGPRLQSHLSMQLQQLHLVKLMQRTDAEASRTDCTNVHPSDLPASVASRLGLEHQCDNTPSAPHMSARHCLGSATTSSYQGTGCGGGGHHRYGGGHWNRDPRDGSGLPFRDDFRRGSAGTEGLSDMWRYRQECGVSQDSSDDMGDWYSSSGGALTPSTPGCAPFLVHPSVYPAHQPIRRGSLPCDFSFSGDLRMLETS